MFQHSSKCLQSSSSSQVTAHSSLRLSSSIEYEWERLSYLQYPPELPHIFDAGCLFGPDGIEGGLWPQCPKSPNASVANVALIKIRLIEVFKIGHINVKVVILVSVRLIKGALVSQTNLGRRLVADRPLSIDFLALILVAAPILVALIFISSLSRWD